MNHNSYLKRAVRDTLPVMAGYVVLGIGFGMILKSKGYGLLPAFLMSTFIYAGSMQYVAIDLLTSSAAYLTVALTTFMVNARHLFYGLSVVDKYKGTGAVKPYLIFALTDETYSLVVADTDTPPQDRKKYYFLVSFLDHIYWIAGGVVGSLVGSLITINTEGMDFALTALFVTIFVEQWIKNKNHVSAAVGVAVTLASLLLFGTQYFLIPAMLVILGLLLILRRWEEVKYE